MSNILRSLLLAGLAWGAFLWFVQLTVDEVIPRMPLPGMVLVGAALATSIQVLATIAQTFRDAHSSGLIENLRAGRNAGPFALYLRSFTYDDDARLYRGLSPTQAISGVTRSLSALWKDDRALSVFIDKRIRERGGVNHVISVDQRSVGYLGPARIASADADWKSLVALLAGAAKIIAIALDMSPGTAWEFAYLRDNRLMHKVVMIVPPAPTDDETNAYRMYWPDQAKRYDERRNQLFEWVAKELAVSPPHDKNAGFVVIFAGDGRAQEVLPFSISSSAERRGSSQLGEAIARIRA